MYLWFTIFLYLIIPMNVLSQCIDEIFDASNFYAFVSTKTDYDHVHGTIERLNPECRPISAWMVMRHTTRYPTSDEVPMLLNLQKIRDVILKNHKKRQGCLRSEKIRLLLEWKPSRFLNERYASKAAPIGIAEAESLGSRIRSTFPELLVSSGQINADTYWFRGTNTQRTMETLKAFSKGFFNQANVIRPQYLHEVDILLQPHSQCRAWESHIANCNVERDRFTNTPGFERFAHSLSERLGFSSKLTFHEIYLMYSMCRYEYAWKKEPNVWCMIFTVEEMKILEYAEDLSYYYSYGPSSSLTGRLGCFALNNMFFHFRQFERAVPRNFTKLVLYGGHTISINLLMMALKTHENSIPLKGLNYDAAGERDYCSSKQAPFLANILAVFHKCQGPGSPNKVMFYQNEKPLHLNYCGGPLCDWDFLKAKFDQSLNMCNLDCCNML